MIRKHPFLFFFLILIVAGSIAGVIYARRPKSIPVRTTPVTRVDELISRVSASGEVTAHDMVDIQAEVAGVITKLPVIEGQKVKKGDLLLELEQFQAQMEVDTQEGRYAASKNDIDRAVQAIATAESNLSRQVEALKSAQSDLAQAELTLTRDNSSLKRYEELLKMRAISQDEYETVEVKARISARRVDVAKAAIAQAQDQIRAMQVAVEQAKVQKTQSEHNLKVADAARKRAQDQMRKTTIVSPINGVIVRNNVDIGERAVPGIQSNPQATLMTIADMDNIETELRVNETDIVRVKLGQQAKITVDALADFTTITGHVTEISAAPIESNSRSSFGSSSGQEGKDFKVVLKVDNPPPPMRIGMLCEAEITIETRQDVLSIPIAALTPRQGEADAQGNYITPPKPAEGQAVGKSAKAEGAQRDPAGVSERGKGKGKGGKGKGSSSRSNKKEFQGVFVKGPDGMAHFRVVKTGIMGDMDVEVLEGLKEGEEVITGPLASLRQLDEWALVREETASERMAGEVRK